VRRRRKGGPLSFAWIDATCHVDLAANLGVYDHDLPSMVIISASKGRVANLMGAYSEDGLNSFAIGVIKGRIQTHEVAQLIEPTDVDCSTVTRPGDYVAEEEDYGDDIVAEILEEERKKQEALEAALEAAAPQVDTTAEEKPDSELTEIEKLEKELEDCGEGEDLLCIARNEKINKQIAKRRELEEKLAKIAAKKKKAKKKAKKAGK